MSKVSIDPEELGVLCICAIRYCQGRQTYMPSLIQEIVIRYLKRLENRDLDVLIDDCDCQYSTQLYGDPHIDKPGWIAYREKLTQEAKRRKLL